MSTVYELCDKGNLQMTDDHFSLASGCLLSIVSYIACVKFIAESRDEGLTTKNCGIYNAGIEDELYGTLQEVLVL